MLNNKNRPWENPKQNKNIRPREYILELSNKLFETSFTTNYCKSFL